MTRKLSGNGQGFPRWLVITVSLLLLIPFVFSCAPVAPEAVAPAPSAKIKTGGTLHLVGEFDTKGFDPYIGADVVKRRLHDQVFNRLLMWPPSMDPVAAIGDLAESWSQPDPKTYVFHLRKGVKWHNKPPVNGREFDAEDVKLSFERQMSPNPKFQTRYYYELVDRIETPDKYTVRILLKELNAAFLDILTVRGTAIILPKEVVRQVGENEVPFELMIGTGPFTWEGYTPAVNGVFKKNPEFFRKDRPYLDGVEVHIIPESATRVAAFRAGELDIVHTGKAEHDQVMSTNPKTTVIQIPGINPEAVSANHLRLRGDKPPFKDVRVRKAVALAIDYDEIIKTVFDGAGTRTGFLPPWYHDLWGAPLVKDLWQRDVAKAKQLMAEAGYAGGFKASILGSNRRRGWADPAVVLREQLKQIGIDVTPNIIEHGQYAAQMYRSEYEMNLGATTSSPYDGAYTGDPYPMLYAPYHTKGGRNFDKYSNPEVDRLIEELGRTLDMAKRKELTIKIQKILMEEFPEIPLMYAYGYHMLQPWVKNWKPSLFNEMDWNFETWLDK